MESLQYEMKTKVGPIYLTANETELTGVFWRKPKLRAVKSYRESKVLTQTVEQLEEYFEGKRKNFDLPLAVSGTPFQRKVWTELTKIPFGKTCSYKDIARKIKNEKAVRAVGTTNGRNPFSIIVPCHRVIAADGTLGGYAGGLSVKTKLLELERDRE